VLLDFLVGEAQDANTALCQKLGALGIMCGPFRIKVNVTIDFYRQLMLNTKHVENELSVRVLPPKLEARQLPIT